MPGNIAAEHIGAKAMGSPKGVPGVRRLEDTNDEWGKNPR
jgi:hypothetical protein